MGGSNERVSAGVLTSCSPRRLLIPFPLNHLPPVTFLLLSLLRCYPLVTFFVPFLRFHLPLVIFLAPLFPCYPLVTFFPSFPSFSSPFGIFFFHLRFHLPLLNLIPLLRFPPPSRVAFLFLSFIIILLLSPLLLPSLVVLILPLSSIPTYI